MRLAQENSAQAKLPSLQRHDACMHEPREQMTDEARALGVIVSQGLIAAWLLTAVDANLNIPNQQFCRSKHEYWGLKIRCMFIKTFCIL